MAAGSCTAAGGLDGITVPRMWKAAAQRSRLGDVAVVLFLLAQCFDGVFTYVGVVTFGIHVEANPLIGGLMLRFGEGLGLLGAKVVAAVLGIALHLREVHVAVALLALFYYVAAILPWTALLFM
jgi:hypothetical protein